MPHARTDAARARRPGVPPNCLSRHPNGGTRHPGILDATARPQLITPNQSLAEAWSAHSGYSQPLNRALKADGLKSTGNLATVPVLEARENWMKRRRSLFGTAAGAGWCIGSTYPPK